MFWIKGKSGWKFDTSRSLGIGVGPPGSKLSGVGSIGTVYLTSPQGGAWSFNYGYFGAGAGYSMMPVSFTASLADFPNAGEIFILRTFDGVELTASDLTGVCTVQEISVIAAAAGSATAMFLGIPRKKLLLNLGLGDFVGPIGPLLSLLNVTDDFDWASLLTSAKALLVIAGAAIGTPLPAIGISSSVGYLYEITEEAIAPKLNPPPIAPDPLPFRVQYQAHEEGPPIILDGNALFCFDQDVINPDAEAELQVAKQKIASYPGRSLVVEGHTDSIGPAEYNVNLSRRRARRVKAWLIKNAGRVDSNVFAQGYGKDYPVASNRTPGGRRLNRRVEIHVMQSSWVPPRQ